jgi:hypothetical protein
MHLFGGFLRLKLIENNIATRDSAFVILTGCGLDGRGCRLSSPGRDKNFIFSTSIRPALGHIQARFQWVLGAVSPGIERPGCEADNLPPTSAEVKNMWIYKSIPPYVFMV